MTGLVKIQIIIALTMFSFVAVALKWVNANPFTIGFIRLAMACSGILVLVIRKKHLQAFLNSSPKEKRILVAIGLCFSIHWLTYFFSIKLSNASFGVLSLSTYGIFMAVMGKLFRNESLGLKKLLGAFVCFAGVCLLVPELNFENEFTLGIFVGLISAFFYACVPILHKTVIHIDQDLRVFSQFFFALIAFSLTLPYCDFNLSKNDWFGLLYLGFGATLIGHTMWARATTVIPAYLSGLIYYSYIPFTLLISHFTLNETFTTTNLLGGALILIGIILGL